MTAAKVLLRLLEAGLVVSGEVGWLRYRAPEGTFDAEFCAHAAAAHGALIARCEAGAVLPSDRAAWPEEVRHDFKAEAERLVRTAHARTFVHRSALVVIPVAAAVATGTSGNGAHRRPGGCRASPPGTG